MSKPTEVQANESDGTLIVLPLGNNELVALHELGFGGPLIIPASGDAARGAESLIGRGLLTDSAIPTELLLGVWRYVLLPSAIGEITRSGDAGAASWLYYLAADRFVEQTPSENGSIFTLGTFAEIPARICLNVGVLMDAPIEADPMRGHPWAGVKFSALESDDVFEWEGTRRGPGTWEVGGTARSSKDVVGELQKLLVDVANQVLQMEAHPG